MKAGFEGSRVHFRHPPKLPTAATDVFTKIMIMTMRTMIMMIVMTDMTMMMMMSSLPKAAVLLDVNILLCLYLYIFLFVFVFAFYIVFFASYTVG